MSKVNPFQFSDYYERDDVKSEVSDEILVERIGYVSRENQIKNLISAGEKLESYRMGLYGSDTLDSEEFSGGDIYNDDFTDLGNRDVSHVFEDESENTIQENSVSKNDTVNEDVSQNDTVNE